MFGDSGSGDGIRDAIDKSDLKRRLSAAEEPLKKEEQKFTGADTSEFWLYLHGQRSMMKKCMIADARNKAGMPCDSSGVPLRCYTNQSKSVNNKLTRQKEAIVKNDKNKVNLTKLQFTRDVWEEDDKHQQEELEMAICGLNQEFKLMDMVRHLERPADEWFEMTSQQRKCYVSKLSVEDAVAKKTIETNMETPDAEFLEFKEFSVDLEKSLESLNVSVELISTIVKEAKRLLNIKNAIQKMPSLEPKE